MSRRYRGVKKPDPRYAGCWAVLSHSLHEELLPVHCSYANRAGFLTCRYHANYEEEAREKKAE